MKPFLKLGLHGSVPVFDSFDPQYIGDHPLRLMRNNKQGNWYWEKIEYGICHWWFVEVIYR